MEDTFLRTLGACYKGGIDLDFVVLPDIVTGGLRSLDFSLGWAGSRLLTAPSLALVMQDGMSPIDIRRACLPTSYPNIRHLFVGGSVAWKWCTAGLWVDLARELNMSCHIGQCGTLSHLQAAQRLGANSVDSTSPARNNSWGVIAEFRNGSQLDLLGAITPEQ